METEYVGLWFSDVLSIMEDEKGGRNALLEVWRRAQGGRKFL